VLERFAKPVAAAARPSLLKNGDFSRDADGDGVPDGWLFSKGSKQATCRRVRTREGAWAVRLDCPPAEPGGRPTSVMFAQHDVPARKGQWYRIALQAKADGLAGRRVTVTLMNMTGWRSVFEYQRFRPGSNWREFEFEVQARATVTDRTRFQIWYTGPGRLWLADVQLEPRPDPTRGRWLTGLYLDTPTAWDDPYRFFRW
jgi:hypothetical protein